MAQSIEAASKRVVLRSLCSAPLLSGSIPGITLLFKPEWGPKVCW
jgi:hypothetical protein